MAFRFTDQRSARFRVEIGTGTGTAAGVRAALVWIEAEGTPGTEEEGAWRKGAGSFCPKYNNNHYYNYDNTNNTNNSQTIIIFIIIN